MRVLLIEDVEDDAVLLLRYLQKGGIDADSMRVETRETLYAALQRPWDLILCDYSMPQLTGQEALHIVRELYEDLPFIIVSGTIGEDIAVNAMRNGAQDYIMKDNLKRLLPAVHRELQEAGFRRERREAQQRLEYLASFDSLTDLPNRQKFVVELQVILDQAKQKGTRVAVLYLDIDRFKSTNDSLGYQAGNKLLQQVAARLREEVGSNGLVARLAADEFAIMIWDIHAKSVLHMLEPRFKELMQPPFDIYGCQIHKTISGGIALFPEDAEAADVLLRNADIAAYSGKGAGGNSFRRYSTSMTVELNERLALEERMHLALAEQQFLLHYQPQIDSVSGLVVGVEALIRWRPGDHEPFIAPDRFIPLAEETGFILELGDWVLQTACYQASQWRKAGLGLCVAVNISARQLHQYDFAERVRRVLLANDLPANSLELEITESAIMQDMHQALQSLRRLQEIGVSVSLDDFGTGYSSLSYLKFFKVDTLKIDRSFVKGIPEDKDDTAITGAIIAMSERLGIRVVAEGVETEEQSQFLAQEGCHLLQGYYFSRPVPADQISVLVERAAQAQ